jgi:dTDP-4-amino-4,6-dideoxygalactose transaminase
MKTEATSKTTLNQLAFLGGRPNFESILHVGRPNVGNRERLFSRINEMFENRWLSNNGPFAQELEKALANYLDVKHCILMCNATVALEVGSQALELKGEVIVPSFTFVATAHALQWLGITPVFCDIDPVTHNLDTKKVEQLITDRTTGILGVHVWGRACDIDGLNEIAQRYHLKLMFDAAHALGCSYKDQMIGKFGDLEVFSFHATKFFNTFEGGAVTTNRDDVAQKVQRLQNFGFAGMDNVVELGVNGKMSEISAAMGLTSLESLDEFIQANKRNYLAYQKGLAGIPGIKMAEYDGAQKNNFQYVVIEVDENEASITRDLLVKILHAENIRVRRYFYPGCHQMEPYRTLHPQTGTSLLETEKLVLKVIQLPTGTAVSEQDVTIICDLIRFVVSNGREISMKV